MKTAILEVVDAPFSSACLPVHKVTFDVFRKHKTRWLLGEKAEFWVGVVLTKIGNPLTRLAPTFLSTLATTDHVLNTFRIR
jgi:hypothetical protein